MVFVAALVKFHEATQTLLLCDEQLLIHVQKAVASLRTNAKLQHVLLCQRVPSPKVVRQRLWNVESRVRRHDLLRRPIFRVEVYGERLARNKLLFGRNSDSLESVPRIFIGLENDRTI